MAGREHDTEYRQVVEALRASEDHLRAIWRFASDAIAVSDPDGTVTMANPAYCDLYGYDPAEIVGNNFAVIFPAEIRDWANEQYRATFARPEITPGIETVIQRRDGTRRHVESRYQFITRDGQRTAMISMVRDITERVEQQAQLERERGLLRQVVDVLPEAILVVDGRGTFIVVNRTARDLLGMDPSGMTAPLADTEAFERFGVSRVDGTPYPSEELPLQRAFLKGEAVLADQQIIVNRTTGKPTPILVNAAPLRDESGAIVGAVAVFQDISAIKEFEQARSEFFSSVSHDLRNPLAAIRGAAQLARRQVDRLDDPGRRLSERLDLIITTTDRMTAMLDELLDLTRLQLGQSVVLVQESVDLLAILRTCVAGYQRLDGNHTLHIESPVETLFGEWDRRRLSRVFDNLLANSIKYSPNGGAILIRVEPGAEDVVVTVQDQGIGIATTDLDAIFNRYYRSRNAADRFPGQGIGLAGAKLLVELHGGTITATSPGEGQGATLIVRIPLAAQRVAV